MLRIAVYETSSKGFQIIRGRLREAGEFDVQTIHKEYVESPDLISYYDVVIFPGGADHIYAYLSSGKFRAGLRDYISSGGKVIGICGGAVLGKWVLSGFSLSDHLLSLLPYYLYYVLFNRKGKWTVEWQPSNLFGESGVKRMVWAGGPCFSPRQEQFRCQAKYAENKFLLPFKNKPAIVSTYYGSGRLVLFGPHPEYLCGYEDNFHLIIKAIRFLTGCS